MSQIEIDGRRLDDLRRDQHLRQCDLANATGVSKYTMSRWCRDGVHNVRISNLQKIADALQMSLEELLAKIAYPTDNGFQERKLTEAEAEWLSVYRSLSPLRQAKVRVLVDDFVTQEPA